MSDESTTTTGQASAAADYEATTEFTSPPGAVFDALTNAGALSNWWMEASGSGAAGGQLTFTAGADELLMQVDAAERPSTVGWTVLSFEPLADWEGTSMAFDLAPTERGGTHLRFRHAGMTPQLECYESCTLGWQQYLASLVAYVDTGRGDPFGSSTDARATAWDERRRNERGE